MARDVIHEAVKNALIKDGWEILADPYRLEFEDSAWAIDLEAEKLLVATRDRQKILVEIKSFLGRSFTRDFQQALGQYQLYAAVLENKEVDSKLFLAISDIAYQRFFQQTVYQMLVEHYQIQLLVVDVEKEEVVAWMG